jgi:hypothetical protein
VLNKIVYEQKSSLLLIFTQGDAMARCILFATFLLLNPTVFAQQLQLPQGLTKAEFFGEMLALIAFCNLTQSVDQYEFSAGMRAFGVTSSDRAAIESGRRKHYEVFRRDFATVDKHQDFCTKGMTHPFIARTMRRGVPTVAGSDDRRQPEKIVFFGDIFAKIRFCKIPVNDDRFAMLLINMGVKSESIPALREHSANTQKALATEYNTTQRIADLCRVTRTNPTIERLFSGAIAAP